MQATPPPKNDKRTIFGWAMYDWANSAYTTTTVAVLFPALLIDEIVPAGGYRLFGLLVDGEQLGSLLIGFGALVVFACSHLVALAFASRTTWAAAGIVVSVVLWSAA